MDFTTAKGPFVGQRVKALLDSVVNCAFCLSQLPSLIMGKTLLDKFVQRNKKALRCIFVLLFY